MGVPIQASVFAFSLAVAPRQAWAGVDPPDFVQWIKEGKYAVKWTRLSCGKSKDNQRRIEMCSQGD